MYCVEWENRATVRNLPRFIFEKDHPGYFFPLSRQPLSIHPLVEDLGEDARFFLLVQSFYKYLNDIAVIETRVVNHTILNIVGNRLPIDFSTEHKMQLYSIMTDESYHAYVAYDAMLQIQQHTGIVPLPLPQRIEIEYALSAVKSVLDLIYHGMFEVLAVCLAENTLTKEIVGMLDQKETHPFFQQHIKAHLADESRHSGIFFSLLKYIWSTISQDYKVHIARVLPDFIHLYLGISVQTDFDKLILKHIGLTESEVEEAIDDTYGYFQINKNHPMLINILTVLKKADVLSEPYSDHFKKRAWI